MRYFAIGLLIAVCLLKNDKADAQDAKRIPFKQFVERIESSEKVRFYYNPSELDSFFVSNEFRQLPLKEQLTKVLENSSFQFAIDSSGNVFVYNNRYTIQTDISQLIINGNKGRADTSTRPITDFDEPQNQKVITSTLENKLFEIGSRAATQGKTATIAGYIRDARNGEPMAGAVVSIDTPRLHVLTDQFGYFSITLPPGRHQLQVSAVGMKNTRRQIALYSSGKLDIEMLDDVPTLKTVIVTSERNSNVRRMQMGVEKLAIKTIKQVPVLLGEADVLRVILTLPGVTSVGEASTGFNVRGGSADQNLVLYNDATIYNPSHFFGFFSAFNPDVVKSVELYKSSIPEKYGGRLSSVLDVTSKEGNKKKFAGVGGIGLLTSKLTLEGPLVKDRTSFIVGGRTTYSNWILKQLPGDEYKNSKASFSDVDLHVNHSGNAKNSLHFTAYLSNDQFRLNNDTTYKYGNRNIVGKWKHIFNNRFYTTFTGGWDFYQYGVSGDRGSVNGFQLKFRIQQLNFRSDFNYALNAKHNLSFGLTSVRYKLNPGRLDRVDEESLIAPDKISDEQALESALYVGDQITLTDNISLNAGVRYSMFNYLGPQKVYSYINGLPKEVVTMIDSTDYEKGKFIKTYHGPELRLAVRFTLSDSASIKISYNTLRQYIHLLSNTTAISPTDIWKLSDPNIRPQLGEQFSVGFYRNFRANTIETSIELYYKRLKNYLDYKSGAALIMNHHIETDVINTRGRSYGAEILIRKLTGKLNGWLSYTYSKTELQMDDSTAGQLINNGNYYPSNFDKPHNLNLIANYRFSHRYSVSLNTIYSTGRPITLPIAVFNLAGSQRVYYSERNQYRIPDYLRMDFSVNIEGNHKIKKLTHNSWSIGVYNFLARKNPYSIYFTEENGSVKGYQLSIIGTAIPYVTYNFRF
ncbi:MAG TPA: TonB-dependent receptor [Chitinophagaceae bacterium]|nr:TonB-dependent receptor [Chitinophagaceae bacterium]